MNTRRVADASAVVSALSAGDQNSEWVGVELAGMELLAPAVMPFEVANILRRHELAGLLTADQAAQAHADLLELEIELWEHDALAARAWQLRHNLTIYDGCYVALAEIADAALVTLDGGIARAPGTGCLIRTPLK